jgi:hypothetical protein
MPPEANGYVNGRATNGMVCLGVMSDLGVTAWSGYLHACFSHNRTPVCVQNYVDYLSQMSPNTTVHNYAFPGKQSGLVGD